MPRGDGGAAHSMEMEARWDLPSGRMVTADEGDREVQPLWVSDGPATAGLWTWLRAEHTRTGLWPLLLVPDPYDGEFRPWVSGALTHAPFSWAREVFPERMSSPASHDPAGLLAQWWTTYTTVDEEDDIVDNDEHLAVTAPFGKTWPGPAPSRETMTDPGQLAAEFATAFLGDGPLARLGLVAAASGAEALTAVGWAGPCNYDTDTAKFSAVVRDWEHRFGARVVAVGFSTLHLSVASPPADGREALLVAAEHFAFCPDNIWQGSSPYTLAAYAERIIGAHRWDFWWD
jgi:hypothetical protein